MAPRYATGVVKLATIMCCCALGLKGVIPHMSRSSLHCCLQSHGISRLPKADREKPKRYKPTT